MTDPEGTPMSYDEECAALARHFLVDYEALDEGHVRRLAGLIQWAIEDWLSAEFPHGPVSR